MAAMENPISEKLDVAGADRIGRPHSAQSRPRGKFGWLLVIFDNDFRNQTACPKADSQRPHETMQLLN